MSKKGTPKAVETIESNVASAKRDVLKARLIAGVFIVLFLAYMAIVQLTPVLSMLPIQGRGVLILNIAVFMVVMLLSSIAAERVKVKKAILREQQALLERAKNR